MPSFKNLLLTCILSQTLVWIPEKVTPVLVTESFAYLRDFRWTGFRELLPKVHLVVWMGYATIFLKVLNRSSAY